MIEELDARTADEVTVRQLHHLVQAFQDEVYPDRPAVPHDEFARIFRSQPVLPRSRTWVARHEDEAVGVAEMEVWRVGQAHPDVDITVFVAPEWRGRGTGSDLLRQLVSAGRQEGAAVLSAEALPESPGARFLAARGARQVLVDRRSVLELSRVDTALLDDWVRRAAARGGDYSLVGWDGPCPPELVERFAEVRNVMNTAPTGEGYWEDAQWAPEAVRSIERSWVERGHEWWTLAARHDSTSDLVGYTQLLFRSDRPGLATQEDTAVDQAHRNRGLGRWLKAAMLQRLLAERPDVARVETENAGSNAPMLAINETLGFRCVTEMGLWQLPTAAD